jgi:lipopolysaccharide export system protein LptC
VLSRRELGLVLLLTLIVVAAWWLQRPRAPGAEAGLDEGRRADYVVEGIRGMVFDRDGLPERRLQAERLRHYADDGSSELDAPRFALHNDDAPPWLARSRTARVNADGKTILLQQAVRLERAATARSPAIALQTSELLILPERDYVETDRFVTLRRGEDWLTAAQGLRAWLGDPRRVEIDGRVRARLTLATD